MSFFLEWLPNTQIKGVCGIALPALSSHREICVTYENTFVNKFFLNLTPCSTSDINIGQSSVKSMS